MIVVSATLPIMTMAWPISAADTKPRITGIYSDMSYHQESGDLVGTEIFVVYTPNEYVAFFQNWEGGSSRPVVVPVQVSGDTIAFKVPEPSLGAGEYIGRVGKTGFDGTVRYRRPDGTSGKAEPIHLKRKKSYWQ